MSGQPIGGNDSNTGSGTTLSAGYSPSSDSSGSAQGQSATGRPAAASPAASRAPGRWTAPTSR